MTEYLIASRAAIIFWTSLAVVPAEILLRDRDRIGAPRRGAIGLPAWSMRTQPSTEETDAVQTRWPETATGMDWQLALPKKMLCALDERPANGCHRNSSLNPSTGKFRPRIDEEAD
jgi:hypothetical protein